MLRDETALGEPFGLSVLGTVPDGEVGGEPASTWHGLHVGGPAAFLPCSLAPPQPASWELAAILSLGLGIWPVCKWVFHMWYPQELLLFKCFFEI